LNGAVPAIDPDAVTSVLEGLVRGRPRRRVVVPDVVGLGTAEAAAALARAGLRVRTELRSAAPPPQEGVVVDQSRPAGRRVRRRSVVVLGLDFPPAVWRRPRRL
jgi:hypothetical protein